MKRIAFVIALLSVSIALAENLKEWRTPEGKIYFGDKPPSGSVVVKQVQKEVPVLAAPDPAPVVPVEPPAYVWRDGVECQDLKFTELNEKPFEGIARRIIEGTVTHEGKHFVKNVKVCVAKLCDEVRPGGGMTNGDKEDFKLDVLDVPSQARVAVRVECSVREPS